MITILKRPIPELPDAGGYHENLSVLFDDIAFPNALQVREYVVCCVGAPNPELLGRHRDLCREGHLGQRRTGEAEEPDFLKFSIQFHMT